MTTTPFQAVLRFVEGKGPAPAGIQAAMASDPVFASLVAGLQAEAASSSPNWAAIIAALLQVLLPLLIGG